ncbi:MAG: M23 family metallopeptidase [bacterium]
MRYLINIALPRVPRRLFIVLFGLLFAMSACETTPSIPFLLSHPMDQKRITSKFGPRGTGFHNGVDYGAATGTPIKSAGPGKVIFAGRKGGYGNLVIIRHGNECETYYAHMSKINVVHGQKVVGGMIIGRVGATGNATGPHLHFETRVNGKPVNPTLFFR